MLLQAVPQPEVEIPEDEEKEALKAEIESLKEALAEKDQQLNLLLMVKILLIQLKRLTAKKTVGPLKI